MLVQQNGWHMDSTTFLPKCITGEAYNPPRLQFSWLEVVLTAFLEVSLAKSRQPVLVDIPYHKVKGQGNERR